MDFRTFVFARLTDFMARHDFDACARGYDGGSRDRGFSCQEQYLCLAFVQLNFRDGPRDIEKSLRAFQTKDRAAVSRAPTVSLLDDSSVFEMGNVRPQPPRRWSKPDAS